MAWDPGYKTPEQFILWLRHAPWSIWFGRFFALLYPLLVGIKIIFALIESGTFSMPMVYLLASISTAFMMVCFWLVVPYLFKKLFSENLTDETVTLKVDGKEETFKVMRNGKAVQVTLGARVMIYLAFACILAMAVAAAAITLKSIIPTLTGFGVHGVAHLSTASTLGLFAPAAFVVIICYTALALKDVAELLSRENFKETLWKNFNTALGRDAAEQFLDAPEDKRADLQRAYQLRQWKTLATSLVLFGLAVFGTYTTATIGSEIFAHAFPKVFVMLHFVATKPDLAFFSPIMVTMAVIGMAPFLFRTIYKFIETICEGFDTITSLYHECIHEHEMSRLSAIKNCAKYTFVSAVTSVLFFVGFAGMVNALCQGFITSLKYPNLPNRSAEGQAVASLALLGHSFKYASLAFKVPNDLKNGPVKPTAVISLEAEDANLGQKGALIKPFFISYDPQTGERKKTDASKVLQANHCVTTKEGHIQVGKNVPMVAA